MVTRLNQYPDLKSGISGMLPIFSYPNIRSLIATTLVSMSSRLRQDSIPIASRGEHAFEHKKWSYHRDRR